MERIKRANNLWTSDSLFSRSSLNIPIALDNGTSSSSSLSSPSSLVFNNGNITSRSTENNETNRSYAFTDGMSEIRCDDVFLEEENNEASTQSTASSSSSSSNASTSGPRRNSNSKSRKKDKKRKENVYEASQTSNGYDGNCTLDSDDSKEESVADFLIRIDCYIAKSKNQVNSIMRQGSRLTNTYSDDDLFRTSLGQQTRSNVSSSTSYLKRQNSTGNGAVSYSGLRAAANESSNELPQSLVMTQGRKVMSSLKRLEQQQDEMFEL